MKRIHLIPLALAAVLPGCGGESPPPQPGQASLQYYTSSVDGTQQPFGLYLPAGFDPSVPHPVVFYGHGYGGSATSTFPKEKTDVADRLGWILVNLHGRKILFYDGAGEKDLREVLAWLDSRYAIDHSRLFFEGLSMGATGAFRLGARSGLFAAVAGADGWTDFRLWHRHWYAPASPDEWEVEPCRYHPLQAASPLFYAEGFERTRLYIITDLGDTSVWPENGQKLHRRLQELGIPHRYEETPGGHTYGYDIAKIYDFFASVPPKDLSRAVVKARFLQHARDGWLEVRGFRRWGRWAQARGTADTIPPPAPGQPPSIKVALQVENVSRVALYLRGTGAEAGSRIVPEVNGAPGPPGEVGTDPSSPDLVLDIAWNGDTVSSVSEGTLSPFPPLGPLKKRPEQEGPIAQALCDNVMLVYGTSHSDPAVNQANQDEASLFLSIWQNDMDGDLVVKADSEVTTEDMASHNLVLFGTEDSNSVIYQVLNAPGRPFSPPFSIREGQIYLGGEGFIGTQYGCFICYPNPLAPDRMVVISHQTISGWFHGFEALPWFYPDFVVFDTTAALRTGVNGYEYPADAFVKAGWFGADWQFTPAFDVALSLDKTSYAAGSDTTAVITVTVTDSETGAAAAGLPESAFSARIDGLETGISGFAELGGGQYEFSVSIATLDAVAYYLEVTADDGTRLGSGYARLIMQ